MWIPLQNLLSISEVIKEQVTNSLLTVRAIEDWAILVFCLIKYNNIKHRSIKSCQRSYRLVEVKKNRARIFLIQGIHLKRLSYAAQLHSQLGIIQCFFFLLKFLRFFHEYIYNSNVIILTRGLKTRLNFPFLSPYICIILNI